MDKVESGVVRRITLIALKDQLLLIEKAEKYQAKYPVAEVPVVIAFNTEFARDMLREISGYEGTVFTSLTWFADRMNERRPTSWTVESLIQELVRNGRCVNRSQAENTMLDEAFASSSPRSTDTDGPPPRGTGPSPDPTPPPPLNPSVPDSHHEASPAVDAQPERPAHCTPRYNEERSDRKPTKGLLLAKPSGGYPLPTGSEVQVHEPAAIGTRSNQVASVSAGADRPLPPRQSLEKYNEYAKYLAKKHGARFFALGTRELAQLIGCSSGSVCKLEVVVTAKSKGWMKSRPKGKTIPFSQKVEYFQGGHSDPVLQRLVEEDDGLSIRRTSGVGLRP